MVNSAGGALVSVSLGTATAPSHVCSPLDAPTLGSKEKAQVSGTSNDSDNTPRRDCAARMTAFDHLPPRIRAVVNYGGSIDDPQVIASIDRSWPPAGEAEVAVEAREA